MKLGDSARSPAMAAARQPGDALVEGCGSLLTCEHGGLDAKTVATGAAKPGSAATPSGT